MGGIKLTLDLAIGETSAIESTDKGKIQDIVQKVKDLNGRLQDIRREQVFQRVSIRFPPGSRDSFQGYCHDINCQLGTGSRIQRSIGVYKCESGSMDDGSAAGVGYHLCLATFSS